MKTRLTLICLLVALIALMAPACSESFDCRETVSCVVGLGGAVPIAATSGNTGGNAAVSGGSSAGGSGGMSAGGASPIAGSAGALPCGKLCSGTKPYCDVLRGECVQCRAQMDCATGFCDVAAGKCVECLGDDSCVDPAASSCSSTGVCSACADNSQCAHIPGKNVCSAGACVACAAHSDCPLQDLAQCSAQSSSCTACTDDAQCAHIPGKNVCSAGACVQCTGTKAEACGAFVCDSMSKTCSTLTAGTADLCQPCVSDAHCKPGRLCVQEIVNGKMLGFACFWKKGDAQNSAPANCSPDGRPYARALNATSIDGVTADICTLKVSSCLALKQFGNDICKGTDDMTTCGAVPGVDARCVSAETGFKCTMTCGGNEDCIFNCDTSPTPRTCNLNPL